MGIQIEQSINEKDEVASMIEWLASFGATKSNGVTRLLYSKEWMSAQQAMKTEMEKENLITYFDSVGNLFGRLEGTGPSGETILTGSHIDTVKDGGNMTVHMGSSLVSWQLRGCIKPMENRGRRLKSFPFVRRKEADFL